MAQIKLGWSGKYVATFDDIDLPLISKYDWYLRRKERSHYVVATIDGKSTYMHQLILPNDNPLLECDHIDYNGLNNCRANLRLITRSLNAHRKRFTASNAGHKGVSYIASRGKYQATIQVNGKSIYLGRYKNIENAIKAYKKASLEYFGE